MAHRRRPPSKKHDNADINALKAMIRECQQKAARAAGQGKPMMWAYYLRMAGRLWQELGGVSPGGGINTVALQVHRRAIKTCRHLPPDDAADLWGLGVYCRRILKATGVTIPRTEVDISWLRNRVASAASAPLR